MFYLKSRRVFLNSLISKYDVTLGLQRLGLFDWAIATAEYASVLEPYNPHPLVALALAHGSRDSLGSGNQKDSALSVVIAATRQLDDRYYDLDFFQHLQEAGFSTEQISQTRTLFFQQE